MVVILIGELYVVDYKHFLFLKNVISNDEKTDRVYKIPSRKLKCSKSNCREKHRLYEQNEFTTKRKDRVIKKRNKSFTWIKINL